ncbi:hypothetical protein BJ508DRAFT_315816 [Ascobolus immersus RN42]|uniref:Uncharacterized protein n=1 Tax=Ascobolus immersus RN42 TaxID=1160509 RepID=A0A3N4HDA1_ASCIM|nr:hypothetical protein BJ508DRAFT_315816 [Ascobolus immersus RN42]
MSLTPSGGASIVITVSFLFFSVSLSLSLLPFTTNPTPKHQITTQSRQRSKPVNSGLGQDLWIALTGKTSSTHHSRACLNRTRPVFWTAFDNSCRGMGSVNIRKGRPREKPDVSRDSSPVWPITTVRISRRRMRPSSRLPHKPFGTSYNKLLRLPQILLVDDGRNAKPVIVLSQQQAVDSLPRPLSVLVLEAGQLQAAAPSLPVHDVLQRLLGSRIQASDVLHLYLHRGSRHQLAPTTLEVCEIAVSLCQKFPVFRLKPRPGLPRVHRAWLSVRRTRRCGISRRSIWELGHQRRRKPANKEGAGKLAKQHHQPERQDQGFELRATHCEDSLPPHNPLPLNPLHPPSNLASLFPHHVTTMSVPPNDASPEPGLFEEPSLELVREAIKLDLCGNSKAVTLLQKLTRVRLAYGTPAWTQLRSGFPAEARITYEIGDYQSLRRSFLHQYELWQASVQPRPTVPPELLGQRRRRQASAAMITPLPAANGDQLHLDGLEAPSQNNSLIISTPMPRSTQLPLSAWLSIQGARLAAMLPNMPTFPATPTPVSSSFPGDYPLSPDGLKQDMALVDSFLAHTHLDPTEFTATPEELCEDLADSSADASALILHHQVVRSESLYSDAEDKPEEPRPSHDEQTPDTDPVPFPFIPNFPSLWSDEVEEQLEEAERDREQEDRESTGSVSSLDEDYLRRPEMSYYPHQPLFTTLHPARTIFSTEFDRAISSPLRPTEIEEPFTDDVDTLGSPASANEPGVLPPWRSPSLRPSGVKFLQETFFPLHSPPSQPPTLIVEDLLPHLPFVPPSVIEHAVQIVNATAPMAALTPDQFSTFLNSIVNKLGSTEKKTTSFKDAKVGVFHPGLPVDATHPAGRSCVVNGITYYRHPRLMRAEIEFLKTVVDPAELARCLPTKMEGPARTWWRDILTAEERKAIMEDATLKLWEEKLIKQFEQEDEDPYSTIYENRFTIARLKGAEDLSAWLMEQSALINQAGIAEDRKAKTLYTCFDAVLKSEFGPPGNMTMNAYIGAIQTKAYVYKQKVAQEDAEVRARDVRNMTDIISVVRQATQNRPTQQVPNNTTYQAGQFAPASAAPSYSKPAALPTPPVNSSGFGFNTSNSGFGSGSSGFSGRPCRHCNGAHMDNACPQRPAGGSRPCRFCGQGHFDHACPQKPAAFKNCSHCQGPHYTSVCPLVPKDGDNQLKPAPSPSFNMQVGKPSPTNNTSTTQSTAFVHTNVSTAEPEQNLCGACHGSFPTKQALYSHAILTGHQIDAEETLHHVGMVRFDGLFTFEEERALEPPSSSGRIIHPGRGFAVAPAGNTPLRPRRPCGFGTLKDSSTIKIYSDATVKKKRAEADHQSKSDATVRKKAFNTV